MREPKKSGVCEECGMEIDERKPGWGHRKDASGICGGYTFTVPQDLKDFLRAAPKEATGEELARSWIDLVLAKEDAENAKKERNR